MTTITTTGPRIMTAEERDAAIQQYGPLVKFVVGRLSIGLPAVLEYEDLISYGTIGLIEALDRFDDSKGIKFETYAFQRIRGAIIDAFRHLDRLPRSVRQKAKRLDQVRTSLTGSLNRQPTEAELADGMGMTMKEYHQALIDCSWATISLDGLLDRDDDHEGSGFTEFPADPDQEDFTEALEKRQLLDALTSAVKILPERELLIVSLYYQEKVTMKQISQILDISESRVCQLHARALARLRSRLAPDRVAA